MPVYNAGEYLKTAVVSILTQSLKEFELILVDDGSTDGSSERCDEYARQDSRVVVLHQKNGGICNARNAALKIARGEYIAFSDHDDKYLPGLLENAYNRALKDHSDIIKFCKKEYVIINGTTVRTKGTLLSDNMYSTLGIKEHFFDLLNSKVFECVWDALFRREFIQKNNIAFDEEYKSGGEDIDIIARVMTKAKVFSTMKEHYYEHYIRSGFSTSSKFNISKLESNKKLAQRISQAIVDMDINLNDHKAEYVYQIMFTLVNASTNMLANPQCTLNESEKLNYISSLKTEPCITEWFFKVPIYSVYNISKKVGISYFFFKSGLYKAMLLMFSLRKKQMERKAK